MAVLQCAEAAKILGGEWKFLLPQHVSEDSEEMRIERTYWKKYMVKFWGKNAFAEFRFSHISVVAK